MDLGRPENVELLFRRGRDGNGQGLINLHRRAAMMTTSTDTTGSASAEALSAPFGPAADRRGVRCAEPAEPGRFRAAAGGGAGFQVTPGGGEESAAAG